MFAKRFLKTPTVRLHAFIFKIGSFYFNSRYIASTDHTFINCLNEERQHAYKLIKHGDDTKVTHMLVDRNKIKIISMY